MHYILSWGPLAPKERESDLPQRRLISEAHCLMASKVSIAPNSFSLIVFLQTKVVGFVCPSVPPILHPPGEGGEKGLTILRARQHSPYRICR